MNYYATILHPEVLEEFLINRRKWQWITYPVTIIYFTLKTLFVASILWTSLLLINKKRTFKRIWQIAIVAQTVFVLKSYFLLLKVVFSEHPNLTELQDFHPLSLSSIMERNSLSIYWTYILQTINVFEFFYWCVLAYLLSRFLKAHFNEGLKVVVVSYIPAFVIWLLAVTFFLVSNN